MTGVQTCALTIFGPRHAGTTPGHPTGCVGGIAEPDPLGVVGKPVVSPELSHAVAVVGADREVQIAVVVKVAKGRRRVGFEVTDASGLAQLGERPGAVGTLVAEKARPVRKRDVARVRQIGGKEVEIAVVVGVDPLGAGAVTVGARFA